ncbi:hypothetical protein SAMN05892877_104241 [Rhizobium subbaraonis]|uniref:Uncharacterized protein n=1 Tax=Rhizobium subbaraonis TaxID=908946 RepID=A0A285UAP1_9HYPH|nr:hypothetical protein SAMN05892877_104241 [Rhizobium subbaraonis]
MTHKCNWKQINIFGYYQLSSRYRTNRQVELILEILESKTT